MFLSATAEGLTIEQLITDFGRTSELTQTAKFRSKAEEMNREATREEILLEVNAAYFGGSASAGHPGRGASNRK